MRADYDKAGQGCLFRPSSALLGAAAIDPSWYLEVINEFGTTTLYDDPFLVDSLAWQQFEKIVKEEGLAAFSGLQSLAPVSAFGDTSALQTW
jgi:hypothetical protein